MSRNKLVQRGVAIVLALLLLVGTLTTAGVLYSKAEPAPAGEYLSTPTVEYAKGDLNGDGRITVSDVMEGCRILSRKLSGAEEDPRVLWAFDITGEGETTILDVMEICRAIVRGGRPEGPLWPSDELVSGGQYNLVSGCGQKLLSVANASQRNKGNVQQWSNTGSDAQRWLIEDVGEGYYKLINVSSGRALDVESSSPDSGANVWQYAYNDSTAQKWKFIRDEDGSYRIQAACAPERSLDVSGSSADDGANVQQYDSNDSSAQKWYLRQVEPQDAAPTAELADAAFDAWVEQYYTVDGASTYRYGFFTKDFWKSAEMFEVVIDAYERTGNPRYKEMIDECYRGFIMTQGNKWDWNQFNDDIMWIVIACARAYKATGNQAYLDQAKYHFDIVYERAWDTTVFGGGMFWTIANKNKNSCINGPAAVAACLLGEALQDESYYETAKRIIDWQRANLVEVETGKVYDAWNSTGSGANQAEYELNTWASTYNQGTWIGANTLLYLHTGEQRYFDDAKLAADYTMNTMFRGGVMNTEGGSNQDLLGFKGILTRWLGVFIRECEQDQYTDWLQLNAKVGWNNRNADGIVQTQLGTQTGKTSDYIAWSSSSFVALMQNCPLPAEEPEPPVDPDPPVNPDPPVDPDPPVNPDPPVEPSDDIVSGMQYALLSDCGGTLLSVENSSQKNKGNVSQWRNTTSDSQRWLIEDAGEGYYKLTSVSSGCVLGVENGSSENADVRQYRSDGSDAQKWKFTKNEDGTYRIQAACAPGCSLDVSGASDADGANVQQYPSHNEKAQKWRLKQVEPQDAAPTPALADAAFDAWVKQYYSVSDSPDGAAGSFINDFWKGAEMFEVVLDAYARTGSDRHREMIDECYRGFVANNSAQWEGNGFNDDIMWITIACARAYEATGNQTYLDQAKRHFDIVYERAWDTTLFGGGMFWNTENENKNSCINGPAAIAACLLGDALQDESYYDKAKQINAWQRSKLVETETGRVYDAYNCEGDASKEEDYALNTWASTYNQGTWIGACTLLYLHTGEQQYFDDAKLAADYTVNTMYRKGVMNTEGGNNWDLWGFKGILTRWLGVFIRECGQNQYTDWLQLNAKVGWDNRNADGLTQTQWGTRTGETGADGLCNAWSCSAYVALMQNCPMPGETFEPPVLPSEPSLPSEPATSLPATSLPVSSGSGGDGQFLQLGQKGVGLMNLVQQNFWVPEQQKALERRGQDSPAYLWPYGSYLEALAAVCKANPADQSVRQNYMEALAGVENYNTRREAPGLSYAAAFGGGGDVYYDDNMWIAIAYLKAYNNLKDPAYLAKSRQVAAYCYSGWDDVQGGGIYWCENQKTSKNTCSNAPMAMVSADLFAATGEPAYLNWSKKIYGWTKEKLEDPDDHLYWDNLDLAGNVDTRKYTYNTGCMLSAAAALYTHTGEEQYLTDAKATAAGADAWFFRQKNGQVTLSKNAGSHTWFLSWLNEGFQRLYAADNDPLYLTHMTAAAEAACKAADGEGYIYSGWTAGSGNTDELIQQCGTIRIFMELDAWNQKRDAA